MCALTPAPQGGGLSSGVLARGQSLRGTACACLAKAQPPAVWPVHTPHSAHTRHMQTAPAHPHADTCANTPLAAPTPTPGYRGGRPWHGHRRPPPAPLSPHHLPRQLSLGLRTGAPRREGAGGPPPRGPAPGPGGTLTWSCRGGLRVGTLPKGVPGLGLARPGRRGCHGSGRGDGDGDGDGDGGGAGAAAAGPASATSNPFLRPAPAE